MGGCVCGQVLQRNRIQRRVQRRRSPCEGCSERVGLVYFIAVRGLELPLLVLAPRDLRVPRRDVRAEAVVLAS